MTFVLVPFSKNELQNIFDEHSLKVIDFFIKNSLFAQPEILENQSRLPIFIPKEHIEQWIVQAIGAKPIGSGSYPVDVIGDNWAADIKMLSCKVDKNGNLTNADSGETSLAQKFNDSNFGHNNTLDDLFKQKKYNEILNSWKEILINKYKKVTDKYNNIININYFFILRADTAFHLCGLKVELANLEYASVNIDRATNDSVWLKGFIEDKYGHVKIYKAKKRMELRLKPKEWFDTKLVISFETNFNQEFVDIRKKIKDNEVKNYLNNKLNKIFN